jgi:hypothetical protein
MASADLYEDKSKQSRDTMPPLHEIEEADFVNPKVWPDASENDRQTEFVIDSGRRLDVVVATELKLPKSIKRSRLLLVIEIKVKAKEGSDQTKEYATWALDPHLLKKDDRLFGAESNGSQGSLYRALLFLYWPVNSKKPEKGRAQSDAFRNMTYQVLVDDVLGACEKHPAISEQGRELIREYLHNLAHQNEDQEIGRIAVTPEEKTLVSALWNNPKLKVALNTLVKAGGQYQDPEENAGESEDADNVSSLGQSLVRIDDLVREGLLKIGDKLRYKRADVNEEVEIAADGGLQGIKVNGEIYSAPSAAAKAILKGQVCQGWNRFTVEHNGKTLAELREIYRKEKETPPTEYSDMFFKYAAAVLRSHKPTFIVLEQVTPKIEESFEGESFKLPGNIFCSESKEWIDYSKLLPILEHTDGFVLAYFKGRPEKIARINLKDNPPAFYLADSQERLSGLEATRKIAAECNVLTDSASYQWAANWCVKEGQHKDKRFNVLRQKMLDESCKSTGVEI